MAEANTMDVILVEYTLPNEKDVRIVPLKEFLKLKPEQLTKQNKRIQKALGRLYQLNDRKPPLFNSFPKRKAGPLTINCVHADYQNLYAYYEPNRNMVELAKGSLESTELYLINTFAHELKHAEQCSDEYYQLWRKAQRNDGLAYHQIKYLEEAQAYAFGSYVLYLTQLNSSSKEQLWIYDKPAFPILEKHTKGKNIDSFSDIQCEMMKEVLTILYQMEDYRAEYDDICEISKGDKGLDKRDIPASFHFRDNREALLLLKDMPRETMTSADKLRFAVKMGRQERYLEEPLNKGVSVSSNELLDIIDTEFTRPSKDAHENHLQRSKDMLKFFLSFRMDGKPLMQESDISDLLKGAQASGRKDVEEAMQKYHKEHPDDKRFSEEMFELNCKDKVKEFKERQEMKAAEVKAAVEKKGTSALTTAKVKAIKDR